MAPLPLDSESVLLILENFDSIRAQLTKHFTSAGYDLFSSATLSDALELACENVPDVVIIDYTLRGGGALAAIERLRHCLPHSYIVLIAPEDADIHAKAFRAGASKVIPKTNRITELEDIAAPRCVYPRKRMTTERYMQEPSHASLGLLGGIA
jgi:DNA-binding response OmpR family regulator